MPIGRSPRTDILLKAEKVMLEFGGCVLRLAGLYISLCYLMEKFQGLPLPLKSPGIFSANWHYICVKLNY